MTTEEVQRASLSCSAMRDHWQWGSFGEITGCGGYGPSFAFRNQMHAFWGQENEGQGKSYVFKTISVIPNLVTKVYLIQLHLQKESWHVLEIAVRNWGCWQATSWFRSLQWQVKMQFYFIVKYHKVDRKFKNSNSPWPTRRTWISTSFSP